MSPQPPDAENDPYLAERLAETRDWSAFSRPSAPAESPVEIEKLSVLPEWGGRRILDRFVRGPQAPAAPVPAEPSAARGLESHLKSRLSEVADQALLRQPDALPDPIEAYQQLRRRWGGTS